MKKTNLRKLVAGASAVAMATGMAATIGMGAASAEQEDVSWSEGGTSFVRTVSNANPKVGDTITMSTTFIRTGATAFNDEYVYDVKDLHPSCLAYAPETIVWNGETQSDSIIVDREQSTPESPSLGFVKTHVGLTSWKVPGGGSPRTFSLDYVVTANCERETPLTSGMHYNGSRGNGAYNDKGPAITIQADPIIPGDGDGNGDGNGDNENGGGTGSTGSLGSLGNLFGSLQLS